MSLSSSPRLIKGGLVILPPGGNGAPTRTIALQYNPDSLARSYQVQGTGGDGDGQRAQPFRLKGPAIESIKVEAEIDATDRLESPDQHAETVEHGIGPQLAALESLVHPSAGELQALDALASSGVLEIVPAEAPLVLFVWGRDRIAPVRVTELSITEEAFDAALNPIRARVSIGLRVLSSDDYGFRHRGGALFLNHLRAREALATKSPSATLQALGIDALP
ncbi:MULTISPECIES: CIS tube protein [unclassified Luteimonas]